LVSKYSFKEDNIIVLKNPDKETIIGVLHQLRSIISEKDNYCSFMPGMAIGMKA
jgi:hypothetical protein